MFSAVLCRVKDSPFIIDAIEIESIEQVTKISPILGMPSFIPGVMQNKNSLLTMIDLEQVLYGTVMNINSSSKAVVFNNSNKKYGVLITEALGFNEFDEDQVGETDEALFYLQKVTSQSNEDENLRLMNLEKLMSYLAKFTS
ncbi:chemotaxis protein CheW [Paenibacillus agricola]|uniref:Chemotaxis protein CheW n=1 Tax=Paenibacillus agricola TaxID=2716264 RepID=A0ABX0JE00_9BACL|nr:chemotaxis protein CheW [Paenibacillus agricola]NHN33481.1 chemotaxis protein CheW [Paenibacillus agricola]